MILTDREIAIALRCGQIELQPPPRPESYSSTSVDLTLAKEGRIWNAAGGVQIRPGHENYR
ncbi:hypothetical protein, partial [Arenibaculum sp.]|uniref:hypothetical protein n=1 Tax=Arenibaculum sp. TaxID=2865862 RepID=UPI002E16652C|nr:hypothetical protein [Arenibaculum sp.]